MFDPFHKILLCALILVFMEDSCLAFVLIFIVLGL